MQTDSSLCGECEKTKKELKSKEEVFLRIKKKIFKTDQLLALYAETKNKLTVTESAAQELASQLATLEGKYKLDKASWQEKVAEVTKLESELTSLKQHREKISLIRKELDVARSFEAQCLVYKQQNSVLETKLTYWQAQVVELEKKLNATQNKSYKSCGVQAVVDLVLNEETGLIDIKECYEENIKIRQLQEEIQKLTNQCDLAQQDCEELEGKLLEKEIEISGLKLKLKEQQISQKKSNTTEVHALKLELKKANSELQEAKSEANKLRSRAEKTTVLKLKCSKLESALTKKDLENSSLKSELRSLSTSITDFTAPPSCSSGFSSCHTNDLEQEEVDSDNDSCEDDRFDSGIAESLKTSSLLEEPVDKEDNRCSKRVTSCSVNDPKSTSLEEEVELCVQSVDQSNGRETSALLPKEDGQILTSKSLFDALAEAEDLPQSSATNKTHPCNSSIQTTSVSCLEVLAEAQHLPVFAAKDTTSSTEVVDCIESRPQQKEKEEDGQILTSKSLFDTLAEAEDLPQSSATNKTHPCNSSIQTSVSCLEVLAEAQHLPVFAANDTTSSTEVVDCIESRPQQKEKEEDGQILTSNSSFDALAEAEDLPQSSATNKTHPCNSSIQTSVSCLEVLAEAQHLPVFAAKDTTSSTEVVDCIESRPQQKEKEQTLLTGDLASGSLFEALSEAENLPQSSVKGNTPSAKDLIPAGAENLAPSRQLANSLSPVHNPLPVRLASNEVEALVEPDYLIQDKYDKESVVTASDILLEIPVETVDLPQTSDDFEEEASANNLTQPLEENVAEPSTESEEFCNINEKGGNKCSSEELNDNQVVNPLLEVPPESSAYREESFIEKRQHCVKKDCSKYKTDEDGNEEVMKILQVMKMPELILPLSSDPLRVQSNAGTETPKHVSKSQTIQASFVKLNRLGDIKNNGKQELPQTVLHTSVVPATHTPKHISKSQSTQTELIKEHSRCLNDFGENIQQDMPQSIPSTSVTQPSGFSIRHDKFQPKIRPNCRTASRHHPYASQSKHSERQKSVHQGASVVTSEKGFDAVLSLLAIVRSGQIPVDDRVEVVKCAARSLVNISQFLDSNRTDLCECVKNNEENVSAGCDCSKSEGLHDENSSNSSRTLRTIEKLCKRVDVHLADVSQQRSPSCSPENTKENFPSQELKDTMPNYTSERITLPKNLSSEATEITVQMREPSSDGSECEEIVVPTTGCPIGEDKENVPNNPTKSCSKITVQMREPSSDGSECEEIVVATTGCPVGEDKENVPHNPTKSCSDINQMRKHYLQWLSSANTDTSVNTNVEDVSVNTDTSVSTSVEDSISEESSIKNHPRLQWLSTINVDVNTPVNDSIDSNVSEELNVSIGDEGSPSTNREKDRSIAFCEVIAHHILDLKSQLKVSDTLQSAEKNKVTKVSHQRRSSRETSDVIDIDLKDQLKLTDSEESEDDGETDHSKLSRAEENSSISASSTPVACVNRLPKQNSDAVLPPASISVESPSINFNPLQRHVSGKSPAQVIRVHRKPATKLSILKAKILKIRKMKIKMPDYEEVVHKRSTSQNRAASVKLKKQTASTNSRCGLSEAKVTEKIQISCSSLPKKMSVHRKLPIGDLKQTSAAPAIYTKQRHCLKKMEDGVQTSVVVGERQELNLQTSAAPAVYTKQRHYLKKMEDGVETSVVVGERQELNSVSGKCQTEVKGTANFAVTDSERGSDVNNVEIPILKGLPTCNSDIEIVQSDMQTIEQTLPFLPAITSEEPCTNRTVGETSGDDVECHDSVPIIASASCTLKENTTVATNLMEKQTSALNEVVGSKTADKNTGIESMHSSDISHDTTYMSVSKSKVKKIHSLNTSQPRKNVSKCRKTVKRIVSGSDCKEKTFPKLSESFVKSLENLEPSKIIDTSFMNPDTKSFDESSKCTEETLHLPNEHVFGYAQTGPRNVNESDTSHDSESVGESSETLNVNKTVEGNYLPIVEPSSSKSEMSSEASSKQNMLPIMSPTTTNDTNVLLQIQTTFDGRSDLEKNMLFKKLSEKCDGVNRSLLDDEVTSGSETCIPASPSKTSPKQLRGSMSCVAQELVESSQDFVEVAGGENTKAVTNDVPPQSEESSTSCDSSSPKVMRNSNDISPQCSVDTVTQQIEIPLRREASPSKAMTSSPETSSLVAGYQPDTRPIRLTRASVAGDFSASQTQSRQTSAPTNSHDMSKSASELEQVLPIGNSSINHNELHGKSRESGAAHDHVTRQPLSKTETVTEESEPVAGEKCVKKSDPSTTKTPVEGPRRSPRIAKSLPVKACIAVTSPRAAKPTSSSDLEELNHSPENGPNLVSEKVTIVLEYGSHYKSVLQVDKPCSGDSLAVENVANSSFSTKEQQNKNASPKSSVDILRSIDDSCSISSLFGIDEYDNGDDDDDLKLLCPKKRRTSQTCVSSLPVTQSSEKANSTSLTPSCKTVSPCAALSVQPGNRRKTHVLAPDVATLLGRSVERVQLQRSNKVPKVSDHGTLTNSGAVALQPKTSQVDEMNLSMAKEKEEKALSLFPAKALEQLDSNRDTNMVAEHSPLKQISEPHKTSDHLPLMSKPLIPVVSPLRSLSSEHPQYKVIRKRKLTLSDTVTEAIGNPFWNPAFRKMPVNLDSKTGNPVKIISSVSSPLVCSTNSTNKPVKECHGDKNGIPGKINNDLKASEMISIPNFYSCTNSDKSRECLKIENTNNVPEVIVGTSASVNHESTSNKDFENESPKLMKSNCEATLEDRVLTSSGPFSVTQTKYTVDARSMAPLESFKNDIFSVTRKYSSDAAPLHLYTPGYFIRKSHTIYLNQRQSANSLQTHTTKAPKRFRTFAKKTIRQLSELEKYDLLDPKGESILSQIVANLSKIESRIITEEFVAMVMDDRGDPDNKYSPPAPSLSPVQRQVLTLASALQWKRDSIMPDLCAALLSKLCRVTGKKMEIEVLKRCTRMYVALCIAKNDLKSIQGFFYDALYFFQFKAYLMCSIILSMVPGVLPKASQAQDNILVQVMAYILTTLKEDNRSKMNPLWELLVHQYGYPRSTKIHLSHLLMQVDQKLWAGNLEGIEPALNLLAKHVDQQCLHSHIIAPFVHHLKTWKAGCGLPLESNKLVVRVLRNVARTLPKAQTQQFRSIIHRFAELLAMDKPEMEESAAMALLGISASGHHYTDVAKTLYHWQPKQEPSPELVEVAVKFMQEQNPVYWRQFMKRYAQQTEDTTKNQLGNNQLEEREKGSCPMLK